jgi:hypothetical protein
VFVKSVAGDMVEAQAPGGVRELEMIEVRYEWESSSASAGADRNYSPW